MQKRIETAFRRLGWTIAEPDGTDGKEPIFLAEATRGGSRFKVVVQCLPASDPLLLYRRPAKRIARPEPLAGIIPLDLSSCNLPNRTISLIRSSERSCFQYAEEALGAEGGRDLLPEILPVVQRLRRRFLHEYQRALAAEEVKNDLFFLNLLVTDKPLSMLHPQETEAALAGDNPAAMGWEAGFVPLHLSPSRLQPPGQAENRAADQVAALPAWATPSSQSRFRFLLRQLPALYWLISIQTLEESLQFILSYAPRWQSSART